MSYSHLMLCNFNNLKVSLNKQISPHNKIKRSEIRALLPQTQSYYRPCLNRNLHKLSVTKHFSDSDVVHNFSIPHSQSVFFKDFTSFLKPRNNVPELLNHIPFLHEETAHGITCLYRKISVVPKI
jgi:hypothetical protein